MLQLPLCCACIFYFIEVLPHKYIWEHEQTQQLQIQYLFLKYYMPKFPLFYTCLCYYNDGEKHVKKFWNYWTILVAVSHLGGNGLPAEVGALWIQVPRHRPERGGLHYPVWKAIRCYPLRNCSLDPIVGLCIGPVGRGSKGVSHEGSVSGCFLLHCRWSW